MWQLLLRDVTVGLLVGVLITGVWAVRGMADRQVITDLRWQVDSVTRVLTGAKCYFRPLARDTLLTRGHRP